MIGAFSVLKLTKPVSYMFLLERAHIIRAPFVWKRTDDWVWVNGTVLIFISFGALSIWCLITLHAELDSNDDQCRVGIARVPSYVLMILDAIINGSLTVLFAVLLRPTLSVRERPSTTPTENEDDSPSSGNRLSRVIWKLRYLKEDQRRYRSSPNIKKVLRKNIIGSGLTFLVSAANGTVFYANEGNPSAFVCMISCIIDGKSFHSYTRLYCL